MPSFRQILTQFHDKVTARTIADTIASQPDRLPELMDCFFDENIRICQRAAWPLGMLGETHAHLLYPYLPQMIDAVRKPLHNAVIRNVLRTFQYMDFPEEVEGEVFDLCMSKLMDQSQAIAVKAFSMTVCANICMKYPALAAELIPVLEEIIPHGSSGVKARGRKLLVQLRKIAP